MKKQLNPTGWGFIEDALTRKERERLLTSVGLFFDTSVSAVPPPDASEIKLPETRVLVPTPLAGFLSNTANDRLMHAVGRSTRDLLTLRSGAIEHAPDAVATPSSLQELERLLAWADAANIAVIPYGGGSSVVGGINAENLGDVSGCVTVDMQRMNSIHDIDVESLTVHAGAGILGPDLDAALKPHGLSVRHYPQSYFHSTLGGWAATRGAGHFSTRYAKIEDRVQHLAVTLANGQRVETRPLPASSVGPDPNRLWLGSEGALGIITSVGLRVVRTPRHRQTQSIKFEHFENALMAARDMLQGDLCPTQLRILDPFENMMSSVLQGKPAAGALMIVSFEHNRAPVAALMEAAIATCADHGGRPDEQPTEEQPTQNQKTSSADKDVLPSGDWRDTFFRQPYIRDALLDYGVVSETFETAVPWHNVGDRYNAIRQATMDAVLSTCGRGGVNCRTTHAYPDGISLYFSFFGQCRHEAMQQNLAAIKRAASDAVMAQGGTISHHHAMGRDHKVWAAQELAEPWRRAVRAARREFDPNGIMNPGLWFDD